MNSMRRRGEIWLANLNPGSGTEPGKSRPVLIVQGQALLDADHPSTMVVPLSTRLIDESEPIRVRLRARESLQKDSDILLDQVRAIDNRRFKGSAIAQCPAATLAKVDEALRQMLDLA